MGVPTIYKGKGPAPKELKRKAEGEVSEEVNERGKGRALSDEDLPPVKKQKDHAQHDGHQYDVNNFKPQRATRCWQQRVQRTRKSEWRNQNRKL